MKKILASLVILALCVPAMAATVTITDNGGGSATITVAAEGAENIVGLGLDIDVTGGNIDTLSVSPGTFNIYPDAAQALGGSYTYGAGDAIALQDSAGTDTLPSASFAVSVGSLNGETTPGATGAGSVDIDIEVDADVNICVKENALRGGIVLTDGTGEDITNGTAGVVCADVGGPGFGCQDYNLTKKKGGQTDNFVNVADLTYFISFVNNNKTVPSFAIIKSINPGVWDPDYDFTQDDAFINVADLTAMIAYVNNNKTVPSFFLLCP